MKASSLSSLKNPTKKKTFRITLAMVNSTKASWKNRVRTSLIFWSTRRRKAKKWKTLWSISTCSAQSTSLPKRAMTLHQLSPLTPSQIPTINEWSSRAFKPTQKSTYSTIINAIYARSCLSRTSGITARNVRISIFAKCAS